MVRLNVKLPDDIYMLIGRNRRFVRFLLPNEQGYFARLFLEGNPASAVFPRFVGPCVSGSRKVFAFRFLR